MRRDDTKGAIGIAILMAAVTVGAPAYGDVLVTRDGSQLETRGPWEVQGRLVVFTRPDGTLASIRLRDVDLEASEEATSTAAAAEREAAKQASQSGENREDATSEHRESAWVLTDADFTRRLIIDDPEAQEGETTEEGAASEAADATRPPVVLSYEREVDLVDQHVRITASAVSLEVSLFDEQGELIQMRRAELAEAILSPGAETSFHVDFPEVFAFSAVQFRPRSVNLETEKSGDAHIPGPDDAASGAGDELPAGGPPVG
jgi:hypothetical protein